MPLVFDYINDVYWAYDRLFCEVADDHVPLKQKKNGVKIVPRLMDSELCNTINL